MTRRVLVTGATGRTGRHVVAGLLDEGAQVRALVRHPLTAALPAEVEVVPGRLEDVEALTAAAAEVDAAFLLWPLHDAAGAAEVVATLAAHVPHLVYLSAAGSLDSAMEEEAMGGVYADLEEAVVASGASWTFVRPGGFAANTLEWAEQVRAGDVVRLVHPDAGRSLVDERDIAAVAVRALLDPALAGRAVTVTGPATLTQREQVAVIGEVLGRTLTVEEIDAEEARASYAERMGPDFAATALAYWASLVERPETVRDGVRSTTGRPARTYAEWVDHHRRDFQAMSVAEVGAAYTEAFRSGRVDEASGLLDPDVVRVAPLEDGGREVEVRGLVAIAENAERQTDDVTLDAVEVSDPLVGGDRFALRFVFHETERGTGAARRTVKLSLCTVAAGRIVREEVYYHLRGGAAG